MSHNLHIRPSSRTKFNKENINSNIYGGNFKLKRTRVRKNLDHKTFDNRSKPTINLNLTKDELSRQSHAHKHDYSFGSPIDFDNKENKFTPNQTLAHKKLKNPKFPSEFTQNNKSFYRRPDISQRSSSRSLSELLSGNASSQRGFRQRSNRNVAIKKIASKISEKIKLVQYHNFKVLKDFPGFIRESSDDSIVNLEGSSRSYKRNTIIDSWDQNRKKRIVDRNKVNSGYTKESGFPSGSQTARLTREPEIFQQRFMDEYLDAKHNIEIKQKNTKRKTQKENLAKTSRVSVADTSPEVVSRRKAINSKMKYLKEDRKSYVNVVELKLDYNKRLQEVPRITPEPDQGFHPSASMNTPVLWDKYKPNTSRNHVDKFAGTFDQSLVNSIREDEQIEKMSKKVVNLKKMIMATEIKLKAACIKSNQNL